MAKEHAAEEGLINAAAPGTTGKFPGYHLSNVDWAVHRDGVRRDAVVSEGDTVGVGKVRCVEGRCFSWSTA